MDRCPVCGSKLDKDARTCSICGTAFDAVPPTCPLCGSEVDEDATVCPNCGAELAPDVVAAAEGAEAEAPHAPRGTVIDRTDTSLNLSDSEIESAENIAEEVLVDMELEDLVKLTGVGPLKAKILYDSGYTDLRKLKQASVVELMNIPGIGRKSAGEIKTALRDADIEEIRHRHITKETVEPEYQCPLCGTIVSAYETACYECGCIFEPGDLDEADSDRLALSYYDSKLLKDPDNKDLWYARGATLVKMGEHEHAINSFNRALDLDPDFQAAWMSKAEVYNKLGDPTKAAECYSHIISTARAEPVVEAPEAGEGAPGEEPAGDGATPERAPSEGGIVGEMPPDTLPETETGSPAEPAGEAPGTEEPGAGPEKPPAGISPETAGELTEPVTEVGSPAEPAGEAPGTEEPGPRVVKMMPGMDMAGGDTAVMEPDMVTLGEVAHREHNMLPDLDVMSRADLKKYLAKRASHVKPYLALAKELDVDISYAKRLIARAVAESKKGELKVAIGLMEEGIDFAEEEFHRKISADIEHLAGIIRDLKASGIDVSVAVEYISLSKEALESGEMSLAMEELRKGLAAAEDAAGA